MKEANTVPFPVSRGGGRWRRARVIWSRASQDVDGLYQSKINLNCIYSYIIAQAAQTTNIALDFKQHLKTGKKRATFVDLLHKQHKIPARVTRRKSRRKEMLLFPCYCPTEEKLMNEWTWKCVCVCHCLESIVKIMTLCLTAPRTNTCAQTQPQDIRLV